MKRNATLTGLWVLATNAVPSMTTLLARVQADVYLLAFSSAPRAERCCAAIGAEGRPFYVCAANVDAIVRDARASGARGFIVDYDPARAGFDSAHPLPVGDAGARELR
jgi:hypothetical protein